MTPATPDDAPDDTVEQERQDDAAFEKAGFVGAMIALVAVGATAAAWIGKAAKAREAAALDAIPDLLTWWPLPTGDGVSALADWALLAPVVLIVCAFPSRWNGITSWEQALSPWIRWSLAGLAAVIVAITVAFDAASAGRDIGVASVSGVAWLHDGASGDAVPWSQAEQIEIACWDGALTYDVVFPGGRVAPLGRTADDDIGGWIDHVTLVDQTLRAYRVPRQREGEAACLRHYDQGLIPSEKARFLAIVAG